MKSKLSVLMPAAMLLLIFTLICGLIYPAVVTGAAALAAPAKAEGSLIEKDGQSYGSALLGQPFSNERYLWGRAEALITLTLADGSTALYGAASNLSPASEEYAGLIEQRIEKIRAAHPEMGDTAVPLSLVTGSGSGLDPHISPAAAEYQVKRLAKNNNLSEEQVRSIIEKCTDGRFLGIFGEETVNVLKVNLILDGKIN